MRGGELRLGGVRQQPPQAVAGAAKDGADGWPDTVSLFRRHGRRGLTMMGDNLYLVQAGVRTTGVIVANERVWTGHGGHKYDPVARFVARGGQTYVVRDTVGADPPEFRMGEKVTVYYDPQDPQTALIDSDHLRLLPVALLVVGTFFGLGGAWPLLPRQRRCTPTHTRQSMIRPRRSAPARRHRHAQAGRHR
jgi:hypothetical protein